MWSASDVPKWPDQICTENSWQKSYAKFLYIQTKPEIVLLIHSDVPSSQENLPLILVTEKKCEE